MKTMSKYLYKGLMAVCVCVLCACSSDDILDDTQDANLEKKTCTMRFNANRPSFDGTGTRGSDADTWKDGDVVYLQFTTTSGGKATGIATYNKTADIWTVDYTGTLVSGAQARCQARFFDGDVTQKNTSLEISSATAIYEDTLAQYTYDGNEVAILANLIPKTGRMRFCGNQNDTIFVGGIGAYTKYNFSTNKFETSYDDILRVAHNVKSGTDSVFTDYVYGFFADEKTPKVTMTDLFDVFYRNCNPNIFQPGQSGWMNIPHASASKGWSKSNPFLSINYPDSISDDRRQIIDEMINDMIKVESSVFWMGAQNTSSYEKNYYSGAKANESPVHQCIVSPFYMTKYEINMKQYKAVMNYDYQPLNGYSSLKSLPIERYVYTTVADKFMAKLRKITGLNFDYPTEAEWEYAARGGRKTHYYTWAGSNYYSSVSTSCNTRDYWYNIKEGGTLTPNELGFYDMSGNVSEICYSIGNYSEVAFSNPAIDISEDGYLLVTTRGGCGFDYNYGYEEYCTVTNRGSYYLYGSLSAYKQYTVGIRPILRLMQ